MVNVDVINILNHLHLNPVLTIKTYCIIRYICIFTIFININTMHGVVLNSIIKNRTIPASVKKTETVVVIGYIIIFYIIMVCKSMEVDSITSVRMNLVR